MAYLEARIDGEPFGADKRIEVVISPTAEDKANGYPPGDQIFGFGTQGMSYVSGYSGTCAGGADYKRAERLFTAPLQQPGSEHIELAVSLDGGASWQAAPQGVRVQATVPAAGPQEPAERLECIFTHEGLVMDVWHLHAYHSPTEGDMTISHPVATRCELYLDLITELKGDAE